MRVETTSVQRSITSPRSGQRTTARSVGQTLDILERLACCMPLQRLTDEALPVLAANTIQTAAAISADLGYVIPTSPQAGEELR
jgi:hypothetical protein